MYHVFYDLETRFTSLQKALDWFKSLTYLYPEIPRTTGDGEETETPCVCVGESI